jgi:hypothetical protein
MAFILCFGIYVGLQFDLFVHSFKGDDRPDVADSLVGQVTDNPIHLFFLFRNVTNDLVKDKQPHDQDLKKKAQYVHSTYIPQDSIQPCQWLNMG